MKSHITLAPASHALSLTKAAAQTGPRSTSATPTKASKSTSRFILILLSALSCWAA